MRDWNVSKNEANVTLLRCMVCERGRQHRCVVAGIVHRGCEEIPTLPEHALTLKYLNNLNRLQLLKLVFDFGFGNS